MLSELCFPHLDNLHCGKPLGCCLWFPGHYQSKEMVPSSENPSLSQCEIAGCLEYQESQHFGVWDPCALESISPVPSCLWHRAALQQGQTPKATEGKEPGCARAGAVPTGLPAAQVSRGAAAGMRNPRGMLPISESAFQRRELWGDVTQRQPKLCAGFCMSFSCFRPRVRGTS